MPIQFKLFFFLICLLGLSACSLFYTTQRSYVYQVRAGDTLASIAANFQIDYRILAKVNHLSDPDHLDIGQILEIPFTGKQIANQGFQSRVEFSKGVIPDSLHVKPNRNLLRWPVTSKKSRISSKFGWRWLKFHEGLDIAAPTGTPIYAAHHGQVRVSGYQISGYGKMLIIQNKDMLTVYAHNSVNRVDAGQYVSAGQHIADVGETGKATGPHLHFEVRFRNPQRKFVAVDPRLYLP